MELDEECARIEQLRTQDVEHARAREATATQHLNTCQVEEATAAADASAIQAGLERSEQSLRAHRERDGPKKQVPGAAGCSEKRAEGDAKRLVKTRDQVSLTSTTFFHAKSNAAFPY